MFKIKQQRGDTIMEVLICVAVLSFVLSSAFALANRSSQANLQAGERGESSRITESQIERLKTFISQSATPDLPGDGLYFCMYQEAVGATQVLRTKTISSVVISSDDFNNYPSDCKAGTFYNSYIQRVGNTYTAHTRWFAASGRGIDESTMVYRTYPDLASNPTGSTVIDGCPSNQYMLSNGSCSPCLPPEFYISGGGFADKCVPKSPTVEVVVQKVPSCGSAVRSDHAGVSVNLSGGGGPLAGTTTGIPSRSNHYPMDFGATYTASFSPPSGNLPSSQSRPGGDPGVGTTYYEYSPSGGASYSSCAPATASTTTPTRPPDNPPGPADITRAGQTRTITGLTFRPNCSARTKWVYENDPSTYYGDTYISGYNNYYTLGARRGDLDYYARTGYHATYQYYPISVWGYPPIGQQNGKTPHGHVAMKAGTGVMYHGSFGVSGHHTGYSGYSVWQSDYHSDPVYATGPPYYHGRHWVSYGDGSACAS